MPDVLAAVDLGSNSFHLVVARYTHGQLIIIDRLREMVRLAPGVETDGRLDKDVAARALACLERFGQRLRDMHADSVRVVGTNALRIARRKQAFLERAREALGHPIEIVSGMEEARLIYSGVAHTLPAEPGHRLVVDIGGGSTEIIIGEGYEPLAAGEPAARLRVAQRSATSATAGCRRSASSARGWRARRNSSRSRPHSCSAAGSMRSAVPAPCARSASACSELDPRRRGITAEGLEALLAAADRRRGTARARARLGHRRAPAGVRRRRRRSSPRSSPQLGIEQMRFAEGAMRDGLLYDMVGRYTDEDARERTVRSMQQRYHVDLAQAARVEATALRLLAQVATAWELEDPLAELALRWAARLHEIGLDVAHSGYHRHGAYLLENADMPGFAREEQQLLARLVGAHRRKLLLERLEDLIPPWDQLAIHLIVLLRLAVLLHRGRSAVALPDIELARARPHAGAALSVPLAQGTSADRADLQQEIEFLRDGCGCGLQRVPAAAASR